MSGLPNLEEVDFDLSRDTIHYIPHPSLAHGQSDRDNVKDLLERIAKIKEETELSLMLKHETEVSQLKRKVVELENSLEAYKKEYEFHKEAAIKLSSIHERLEIDNKKLLSLISSMREEMVSKEAILSEKILQEQASRERMVQQIIDEHMKGEIEMQAEIEVLRGRLTDYKQALEAERSSNSKKKEEIKKLLSYS